MRTQMHFGTRRGAMGALLGMVMGLLISSTTTLANPNPHFDALIAELQARSASYTNLEDKVEVKTKKKVDKIIASFYKKPSVSLDKDLKLAAKAAKKLSKVFPEEFMPGPTITAVSATVVPDNLSNIIEFLLNSFGGDIEAILAEAQSLVDAALPGKCRDKAQAILDEVAAQLDLVDTAPDLPTAAKLLSKAAKKVLKGQSAAEAALECVPNIGNDEWYVWTMGMMVDSMPLSLYEDARVGGPDSVAVTYFNSGVLSVNMVTEDGSVSMAIAAFVGNPGSAGTYQLSGNFYSGIDSYTITDGYITIPKFPKSLPKRLTATFYFTATGSAGTVEVTQGVLSVWLSPPF